MTNPQHPQQSFQPNQRVVQPGQTGQTVQPGQAPVPPQSSPQKRKPTRTTVCGIIGLVLGVIGFILSFIPIINNFAAILGVIGVILGIIAMVGTFRGKVNGKAIAIVATVLSALALVITLSMQASFSKAFDEATAGSSSSQGSGSSDSNGSKDSGTKEDDSKSSAAGVQDQEGDLKDMHVKIVSAVKSINDYNGKPTVLVTYEWTNKTEKNNSFMVLAHAVVFQNGHQLENAIYGTDRPEGYDVDSQMAEVQPGASMTTTVAYVLEDDSPVTVDVTDLFNLDDKTKVEHTFNLQ